MNFIEKFFAKIAAKKVADQLGLTEGVMDGSKKWYQSKVNLAALVGMILSFYQIGSMVAPVFGMTLPPIPQSLIDIAGMVLGPIIIYGRNTATTTIQ